jgi:hypothetical protein
MQRVVERTEVSLPRYLESLPEYQSIKLNIFNTYRDTVLGRIFTNDANN